ncbi:MAG: dihydropyrimidinase [Chloroflexota bacterium]|nr:dihydropyrimidinase [Chloroflexota bacterium]
MTNERPVDTIIHNAKIVSHDATIDGAIGIRDGRIAFVTDGQDLPHAGNLIDAGGKHVIPGVIDPHTHPGVIGSFADDIRTETRAAAAGGVTSWFATIKSTKMDRNWKAYHDPEDAISYLEACKTGVEIVESESLIDIGFNLAIQGDRDANEIPEIAAEFGVTSYKFYAGYRRANDFARSIGLPLPWDDGTLYIGFENIARIGGLAMLHAEHADVNRVLTDRIKPTGRQDLAAWEERSPDYSEAFHISQYSHFALVLGTTLYIVHTSSKMGLEESNIWRARGTSIVNETCPHYIILNKYSDPPGKWAKINTPIRLKSDNEALWQGLANGTVECMGSDHIPGEGFPDMWGPGHARMASTEHVLPLMLSEGVNRGRLTMEQLVAVTSYNTARRFGVYPRKGAILPGSDADLVIVDLEREETISTSNPKAFHSIAPASIWEGREVKGFPILTMLRGRVIARDGEIVSEGGGEYLRRTPSKLEAATDRKYPRTE